MNMMVNETLIIDDDKIVCMIHERLCKEYGMAQCRIFNYAVEALDYILSRNHRDYSFTILLDINMPGMDGWEFLERLQRQVLKNRIYLILVTSSIDPADRERAQSYRMVKNYITKPLTVQKLQGLLEDHDLRNHMRSLAI